MVNMILKHHQDIKLHYKELVKDKVILQEIKLLKNKENIYLYFIVDQN